MKNTVGGVTLAATLITVVFAGDYSETVQIVALVGAVLLAGFGRWLDSRKP
jgi:hypothetical protein